MKRTKRMRSLVLLVPMLAAAACQSAGGGPVPAGPAEEDAIRQVLVKSTEDWNRGNLEGFVLPYDSMATFVSGSRVLRGKAAISDRYAESYFRTGTPTGVLAFRDLEVRMLGRDHALVVGRYVVSDRATRQESATGIFSLTMVRRPAGWRILHDHSS